MRIEPTTNFTPVAGSTAADGVTKTAATKAVTGTAAAGTGFAPTADLSRLLQLVKEIPDVRGQLVQEILARVDSGELSSPQAALDTAAAVVESNALSGG